MFRLPLFLIPVAALAGCMDEPTALGETSAEVYVDLIAGAEMTVVMAGLNSPRGLGFGPEGALYVAEAGTTSSTGDCIPFIEGTMPLHDATAVPALFRASGKVSRRA